MTTLFTPNDGSRPSLLELGRLLRERRPAAAPGGPQRRPGSRRPDAERRLVGGARRAASGRVRASPSLSSPIPCAFPTSAISSVAVRSQNETCGGLTLAMVVMEGMDGAR